MRRDHQEPLEHSGLELQFLGELLVMDDNERDADEPDFDDVQWWLLDEHIRAWLPPYHAHIQRTDPVEYYAGLLELMLAVVTARHDELAERRHP